RPRRRAGALFNARTTAGRTVSTGACGPLRAAVTTPRSMPARGDWCRPPSGRGGRSCSPTRIRAPNRYPRRCVTYPRSSPSTASTSTACGSGAACITRSAPTGRSRSRTTWSATTARSTILASSTCSTSAASSCAPRGCVRASSRQSTPAHLTGAGYLDYWFGEDVDERWIEQLFELDDQVGAEDTALVEAAQRGTSAGLIDRGWVFGGAEMLIAHFQDFVRERLALDQASGASSDH